jgi:hypothetical protein
VLQLGKVVQDGAPDFQYGARGFAGSSCNAKWSVCPTKRPPSPNRSRLAQFRLHVRIASSEQHARESETSRCSCKLRLRIIHPVMLPHAGDEQSLQHVPFDRLLQYLCIPKTQTRT